MIIVNIKNGLGNQMFQYAFGKVIEWKYQTQVYFDLLRDDISTPLQTDLDVFNIEPILEAKPQWRIPFLPFSVRQYRDKKLYIHYIYYKLRRKFQSNKLITERYPSKYLKLFNKIDIKKKYYFLGFWQNPAYFIGYEDKIRDLFSPKDKNVICSKESTEIINSQYETVSIHFRRGDYLTSGFIEPVEKDFYINAIEIIKQKVKNPFFYIFTNDPEWFENEMKIDIPHKLITGNVDKNAYIDILLMSKCKHNIIANSTFSWWGAWLNENPDKCVIAPKKWYADEKRNKFASEITPKEWIRL